MSTLASTFNSLPRAVKWALLACGFVVVFFAIVEPALKFVDSIRAKAERIESNLARDASLSDPASDDGRMLALSLEQFGSPIRPGDPTATAETLYRLVDRVLKEHGVEDASITERSAQLRSDLIEPVVGSTVVNKFILEVSFDADSTTALEVLAALEQSPEVSAVGRVKFDKLAVRSSSSGTPAEASDTLRVTLAPELWLTQSPDSGGAP
jgi:hypothetical protein